MMPAEGSAGSDAQAWARWDPRAGARRVPWGTVGPWVAHTVSKCPRICITETGDLEARSIRAAALFLGPDALQDDPQHR
jgi:hypothetical protein